MKGTNGGIGAGKENTQAIVTHSLTTGVNCRAATVCGTIRSGGYDDWFLPSKGGLNLMFVYLQEAGIGGFKEDWYWSSSLNDSGHALIQNFRNGSQDNSGNTYGRLVRAIRQF